MFSSTPWRNLWLSKAGTRLLLVSYIECVPAHSLQLTSANFSTFARINLCLRGLCYDFQLGTMAWYGIYNMSKHILSIHHNHRPIQFHKSTNNHQPSLPHRMHFPTTTTVIAFLTAAALPSALAASCTGYQTTPFNIAACADQLTARGSELCKVTSGFTTTFCEIGDAMIVGVGVGSPSGVETSSPW